MLNMVWFKMIVRLLGIYLFDVCMCCKWAHGCIRNLIWSSLCISDDVVNIVLSM